MDSAARLRLWTPRLLFLAVTGILVLVGAIQYQWFSRSATGEIEATVHGMESGIRQAVVREFQRYAPVISELEALSGRPRLDETVVRPVLERLWAAYGATEASPRLLSWVGYLLPGQKVVHRLGSADWTLASGPEPWVEAALRPPLRTPEGFQVADTVVYRPSPLPGAPVLVLGLDVPGFFTTYVRPALADLLPGAQWAWNTGPREPPPPGFDSHTYAFNPFTALAGGASLPPYLEVGIPRFIDLPWKAARTRSPGPVPGPGFRGMESWNLKVTLPADAPVLGIERRLAWNWLGSTLLLVVLGAAFGLILRQSGRLSDLRRREREFVASVSHELRTPLTVIRSAADNFVRGIVPPERQGRYGELILDQALRLGRMIEQMLSFAQAEAAPRAAVQAVLKFGPWLGELRPPLEALASARTVTLVWDVAGVPPEGLTDPEALRLILENLVVNAINHAYPLAGPRTVKVTLRHLVPDRLELTVDDEGRGISPKEAKKVFEPFYRDEVSRNAQETGSGLGLFLARRQARRLGGNLTLESPWRRLDGTRRPGCRFVLTVPFRPGIGAVDHGR